MEYNKELNFEAKVLGKVTGVKSLEEKKDKTFLEKLNTEDIYCAVKKIEISKEKLHRSGENGLNVPDNFFNFSEVEITSSKLIEIFDSCESYNFNISNRNSRRPITCVAKLDDRASIFINFDQFKNNKESDYINQKLCEDKSTIKIYDNIFYIPKEPLINLILLADKMFSQHNEKFYLLEDINFTNKKEFFLKSIFYKIKNLLFYKKYNKILETENKKINIRIVYP